MTLPQQNWSKIRIPLTVPRAVFFKSNEVCTAGIPKMFSSPFESGPIILHTMRFQRVKPIGLFLFSLLVTAYPSFAQKSEAAKGRNLPLWKIEGLKNQVYLLGSIHLL